MNWQMKKLYLKKLFIINLLSALVLWMGGLVTQKSVYASEVTDITVNKDNYSKYFKQNGDAVGKYDSTTGTQIITDNTYQVGNVAFMGSVNLNFDFSVSGQLNLGIPTTVGKYSGVADGIGFVFYQGKRDQVGGTAGNLGIYGLPNVFGWKVDTWFNKDGSDVGTGKKLLGEGDSKYMNQNGDPYGAFITTDSSGWGSIDGNTVSMIPRAKLVDGQNHPFKFEYQAAQRKLTISLTVGGETYQFAKTILFNDENPLYYFTISAGTGVLPTHQSFVFDSLKYKTAQRAIINYIDDDENGKILSTDDVIGNGGEVIDYQTANKISKYEESNYELVSDSFTDATDAQKIFDYDDKTDQEFAVHLKHKHSQKEETKQVTHTIKYQYALTVIQSISPAADYVNKLSFSRTVDTDEVTKKVTNGPWEPTFGTFPEVKSPEVEGYKADKESIAEYSKITGDSKDITDTVTYSNGPVTTKYIDQETKKEIAPATIQTGRTGENYTTEAKFIDNYVLTKIPANANGKYTKDAITVTYTYRKVEAPVTETGKVITKYVDEDGKEIADPVEQSGRVGDSYVTEAIAKDDYSLDLSKQPANASGKFTKDIITVIYVYKKVEAPTTETGKVITKYVDENGKEIADSVEQSGRVGDSYTTQAIVKDGYILDETKLPTNIKGKFTRDTITVTYVYKKKDSGKPTDPVVVVPIERGRVITQYIDEDGKAITNPMEQSGRVGDSYVTSAITLDGYILDETKLPTNAKGNFINGVVTVTYVYKKKDSDNPAKESTKPEAATPVKTSTVVTKYVDEDGNKIATDKIQRGRVGDSYTTQAVAKDGYILDETRLPHNAKGKFTQTTIIVKYVYKRVRAVKESTVLAEISKPRADTKQRNGSKTKLPTTGANTSSIAILVGIIMLLTVVVMILKKISKKL